MPFDFPPRELVVLSGVYLPPLLVAATIGGFAAWLTVLLLNRYRLSRFFAYPPIVLLSLAIIYTVLAGTFLVPI